MNNFKKFRIIKKTLKNKAGQVYMSMAIKVIISLIIGSLVSGGLYVLVDKVALPEASDSVSDLAAKQYELGADSDGLVSGVGNISSTEVMTVAQLEKKYSFKYYSNISTAYNDVNAGSLTHANIPKSQKANAYAGVYSDNGVYNIVVLKNLTISENLQLNVNANLNLGGKVITADSNAAKLTFNGNSVVDGRLEGSRITKNINNGGNSNLLYATQHIKIMGGTYEQRGVYSTVAMTFKFGDHSEVEVKNCSVTAYNDNNKGQARTIQDSSDNASYSSVTALAYQKSGSGKSICLYTDIGDTQIANCNFTASGKPITIQTIWTANTKGELDVSNTNINVTSDGSTNIAAYACVLQNTGATTFDHVNMTMNVEEFERCVAAQIKRAADNDVLFKDSTITQNSSSTAYYNGTGFLVGISCDSGDLTRLKLNNTNMTIDSDYGYSAIGVMCKKGLIENSRINMTTATSAHLKGIENDGTLTLNSSVVNVADDTAGATYGLFATDDATVTNVTDSKLYADAPGNLTTVAYGVPICAKGEVNLNDVTARGTEYGVVTREGCNLHVNGGWYDSNSHGGFYFHHGSAHPAYLKNARITNTPYWGKYDPATQTNDRMCSFYIGGASDAAASNMKVYMDNCELGGTDNLYYASGALRGTDGEHDNKLYLSNCTLTKYIRTDANNFLYLGVGNKWKNGNDFVSPSVPGTVTTTSDSYAW